MNAGVIEITVIFVLVMSKKTIVVEKGDTIKTNTIYFFEEKNRQKKVKNKIYLNYGPTTAKLKT